MNWQPTITDSTLEPVSSFVTRTYKPERLRGSFPDGWRDENGLTYAEIVVAGVRESLSERGYVCISHYDAADVQTHFWRPL